MYDVIYWKIFCEKYMFSPSQYALAACQHVSISAHRRRVFVEFSQILIQDINIFKMWHKI